MSHGPSDPMQGKCGIVVQARMSSARLPGKVMMDIEGQAMIQRQVLRLQRGAVLEKVIVATSVDPTDDPLAALCEEIGVCCFRGSLDDVLKRYIDLAEEYEIEHIVRVGGDDPLIDPECCNFLVTEHLGSSVDFRFASHRRGWPYGSAAELISVEALRSIDQKTDRRLYREHIIPFFFDNPEMFSIQAVMAPKEICRPDYFISVDYKEDLELVRTIFKRLTPEGDYFPFSRVVDLLDTQPELLRINAGLHSGFDR